MAGEMETETELTDEALAGAAATRGSTAAIMAQAATRAITRPVHPSRADLSHGRPTVPALRFEPKILVAQLRLRHDGACAAPSALPHARSSATTSAAPPNGAPRPSPAPVSVTGPVPLAGLFQVRADFRTLPALIRAITHNSDRLNARLPTVTKGRELLR